MDAMVKFINTIDSKLSQLPIENGQVIYVSDTRTICVDFNNVRTEYNQIIVLQNENHRLNVLSPLKAFYFVLETNILWRYEEKWIPITSQPKEQIVFMDFEKLPTQGIENVLYITETKSFRWDGSKYIEIGAMLWEEF